jgi:hypothetical protein
MERIWEKWRYRTGVDREAWKRIVQQAKTHKELQRQEKKKKNQKVYDDDGI